MEHRATLAPPPDAGFRRLTVDPATWNRAKGLLLEALAHSAADRDAFLEARCPDPQLRRELQAYLAANADMPTNFLDDPPALDATATGAPPPDASDLAVGTRIGPYVIVDTLGHGGMGRVFLGRDERLHRKVALKSLLASQRRSYEDRARIRREARAAAQINHPNVATIHDVIEHDTGDYIVMEYVEGESLAALIRRERLSTDRVIGIGRQLAAALAAAHAKGVVHRDLKPANIHVTVDGVVKVLDFGVAGATAAFTTVSTGGDGETGQGAHPGTPGYMSPEQAMGRHVDERTDVFSLGVVLFELATGERAFLKTDALDLVTALARPVRRADSVNPDVPPVLADVIAKALAIDMAERYQSAIAVGSALQALQPPTPGAAAEGAAGARQPSRSLLQYVPRIILLASAGVVLLAGLGFLTSMEMRLWLRQSGYVNEDLFEWVRWGAKSAVAPTFVLLATLVALAVLMIVRNLAVSIIPGAQTLDSASQRAIAGTARGLHLQDPSIVASWLLLISTCGLATAWWYFSPLLVAMSKGALSAAPEDLVRLSPESLDTHQLYRLVFSAIAIFSSVAWIQIARIAARRRQEVQGVVLAGGFAVVLLALASLALPFRLLFHNDFERVRWNGSECYVTGSNVDEYLLYCAASDPRVQKVPKNRGTLERLNSHGSTFTPFPKS
jgi:predicted Ser/Thr protein kinase